MNGALCLIRALEECGIDTIFGYPGGAIMPVYDALLDAKIRHILTRHEQGAAFAAIGYARATGRLGVCMATSGPGATNLVTGIADAYMDSVPLLAITGQVPSPLIGTDGFQEVDVLGITMPIVKHSFQVRHAEEVCDTVYEAVRIATNGRPGPVVIDLPKDVANAACTFRPPTDSLWKPSPAPASQQLAHALDVLRQARRPIVYAGGGVVNGDAVAEFRAFVETGGLPTVLTLKGLGALPGTHDLFLGMLGMHGLQAANLAVQECDLLVAIGARFDDRVTGKVAQFAPKAKVIHLDVDESEFGKIRPPDAPVLGDLRNALRALTTPLDLAPWRERCAALKQEHPWDYHPPTEKIYAPRLIRDLSLAAGENVYIACDVGQHQMWVAQHYRFQHPQQHLTSGGLGSMGFGLPAAIGVQLAKPTAIVICVSGDGSIMMNIQELATLSRYKLPVKILLLDNQALGMVRQWQEVFHKQRFSQVDLSDNPDFTRVAEAFGIPALRVETPAQVPGAIDRLLHEAGPLFVHVLIDPAANVWPLVPPAACNSDMVIGRHA
jgi:acetolactate synthase-1/2/3 large subunit